ncbi:carbamoyl-phosphate synthase small chain CarA [Clostridium aceticum]|uniref:Carbamoyl phosphate synthase small chain n=1 Tax=Clostridium aceticum TaxID=84022 RepID=A0A0D8IDX9_9CLOT|nr:glutamine-hydrolyzing carbamoyl-phosphate synthase small subunit [Clostridium aceticum]AKL94174.1 carbamoyl-phosphate synthase small chain CarA [Clostridium aceticum]KJF28483.1 carbamoyl phosphate synthase small subunit [Clostridium aceticum]
MKGYLILEDGMVFEGKVFGSLQEDTGEVVFNTAMAGYQEIFTDNSYNGQILVMTYPMIGNYGINSEDIESNQPTIKGLVVRELCKTPSNWKSENCLDDYLKYHNIMGIEGVDTRKLVKHLREKGTMKGIITISLDHKQEQMEKMQEMDITTKNYTGDVSTEKPYILAGNGPKIALLDFGVKLNILRILKSYDCHITVLPYQTKAEEIMKLGVDGVFLSNGPGNPQTLMPAVENIKKLLHHKPMFGICMGHQLLSLAFGADTYKLKYGHRGGNHPVKDLITNKVYITSQNHGYVVDEKTVNQKELVITHRNLNDGTIEGIQHKYLPVFSVQYHPEASPGPMESKYLFQQFVYNVQHSKEAV